LILSVSKINQHIGQESHHLILKASTIEHNGIYMHIKVASCKCQQITHCHLRGTKSITTIHYTMQIKWKIAAIFKGLTKSIINLTLVEWQSLIFY
jgi:hypothetical protein